MSITENYQLWKEFIAKLDHLVLYTVWYRNFHNIKMYVQTKIINFGKNLLLKIARGI